MIIIFNVEDLLHQDDELLGVQVHVVHLEYISLNLLMTIYI